MKNAIKYLFGGLVVAVAVFFLWKWASNRYVPKKFLETAQKEVFVLKNELGQWQATSEALTATQAETKKLFEGKIRELEETIGGKDIKIKNLKQILEASFVSQGAVELQPIYEVTTDTIALPGEKEVVTVTDPVGYEYHDEWADFKITKNIFWPTLEYEVRDSITFITELDRSIFGRDRYIVTGISKNPNTKIEGIDHFIIEEKPKRLSVGPFVGLDVNGGVTAGIGIQYAILRW